jgi:hypothetical protein
LTETSPPRQVGRILSDQAAAANVAAVMIADADRTRLY